MKHVPLQDITERLLRSSWDILEFLHDHPKTSYSDLRYHLSFGQRRMDSEIARLEGSRLIESERNPSDRRAVLYCLTEYGEDALELIKNNEIEKA